MTDLILFNNARNTMKIQQNLNPKKLVVLINVILCYVLKEAVTQIAQYVCIFSKSTCTIWPGSSWLAKCQKLIKK